MANQYLPGVIQIPSTLIIIDITRASPMVITFIVPSTGSNTYQPNQSVRLTIPRPWGMMQANGLTGKIIGLGVSTMSLSIDSTLFDAFVTPPSGSEGPASLAPSGSMNLQFDNNTDFVPFQSLNNQGN